MTKISFRANGGSINAIEVETGIYKTENISFPKEKGTAADFAKKFDLQVKLLNTYPLFGDIAQFSGDLAKLKEAFSEYLETPELNIVSL